jgi:hypothetical protein
MRQIYFGTLPLCVVSGLDISLSSWCKTLPSVALTDPNVPLVERFGSGRAISGPLVPHEMINVAIIKTKSKTFICIP